MIAQLQVVPKPKKGKLDVTFVSLFFANSSFNIQNCTEISCTIPNLQDYTKGASVYSIEEFVVAAFPPKKRQKCILRGLIFAVSSISFKQIICFGVAEGTELHLIIHVVELNESSAFTPFL